MASRFEVRVGDAEGLGGDSLLIRASSEAAARAQVLESDMMTANPSWEILDVTPKG